MRKKKTKGRKLEPVRGDALQSAIKRHRSKEEDGLSGASWVTEWVPVFWFPVLQCFFTEVTVKVLMDSFGTTTTSLIHHLIYLHSTTTTSGPEYSSQSYRFVFFLVYNSRAEWNSWVVFHTPHVPVHPAVPGVIVTHLLGMAPPPTSKGCQIFFTFSPPLPLHHMTSLLCCLSHPKFPSRCIRQPFDEESLDLTKTNLDW